MGVEVEEGRVGSGNSRLKFGRGLGDGKALELTSSPLLESGLTTSNRARQATLKLSKISTVGYLISQILAQSQVQNELSRRHPPTCTYSP